jgi:hypothetical protein
MNNQKKIRIGGSELGIQNSLISLRFLFVILLSFLIFSGCTRQVVQDEKEAKGIAKEEPQKKAPVAPMIRTQETGPALKEDRKGSPEKEQIGRELEQAVVELRENVSNLKKRLDEEVSENMASFKKDPPEYKIRSGDIIEIIYHMLYEENPAEYLLEVQDSVKI